MQPGPVVGEMGAQRCHLHVCSPDLSSLLPTPKCLCPPVPSGPPRPETISTSSKCFHSLTNASPAGPRLCGQVAVSQKPACRPLGWPSTEDKLPPSVSLPSTLLSYKPRAPL